jgi:hypothetical protein
MKIVYTTIVCGLFYFGFVSCTDRKEGPIDPRVDTRVDQIEMNANETVRDNTRTSDGDWESFRTEAEKRIDENDRKISELEMNNTLAINRSKKEYNEALVDFKERNKKLRSRLRNVKMESREKWNEFKREFNHDMEELGSALNDFTVNNKK